ncbi:TlpA family protein disulfide reductase [Belliella sp. R4-6]|uniref:TlpA family protein disulfide reductase n=1 Tax=Belliella alkalica TaxID=1730871 RepID=A0ABS9VFS4_9BACT|nr:TlpA disulfide reductase family protein [Belliella alkalica]MCH7415291.1 TlpA family protein disulfide reductase [Belliella alkalica]
MKKQITLLIALLLSIYALGQQKLEPLDIGDKIPNLKFDNVLNHSSGEILISDFKGKLLILDFWATWCAPCVASFPKLDSLDKAFGDDLAILPVTYQDKEEVEKLFSRMAKLKDIKKPMVYGDNILRRMLPHKSLPNYVWVNGDSEVVGISEGKDVTAENIKSYIDNGEINFENKVYEEISFNATTPIFLENSEVFKDVLEFQISKSPYVAGIDLFAKVNWGIDDKPLVISLVNMPLINIFSYAYWDKPNERFFGTNRIKMDLAVQEKLKPGYSGTQFLNWLNDGNGHNVEFIIPQFLLPKRDQIIENALDLLFPEYKVRIEQANWPVYALIYEGENINHLKSNKNLRVNKAGFTELIMEYCEIESFISLLNIKNLNRYPRPVINQTGIDFPIDLRLEGNLFNLEDLQKALAIYNLKLVEKDVEIDVLHIQSNQ